MTKAHRALASAHKLLQDNGNAEDSLWVVQQAQAFVEQIDKQFMGR